MKVALQGLICFCRPVINLPQHQTPAVTLQGYLNAHSYTPSTVPTRTFYFLLNTRVSPEENINTI